MKPWLLCVLLSLPFAGFAEVQAQYPFSTKAEQRLFYEVIREARCVVCQNQNLLDSHAPMAADLRQKIYRQVKAGQSKSDIQAFLKARYGDYIFYQPPLQINTLVLWGAPILLLIGAALGAFLYLRKGGADV